MIDKLKIRKPHNLLVDAVLSGGPIGTNDVGSSLYLKKMPIVHVQTIGHNHFLIAKNEKAYRKMYENSNYAIYRRLNRGWI